MRHECWRNYKTGAFLQQRTSWKLQGNGKSAGGCCTLPLANSSNDCCRNHSGYVSTAHCCCTLHLSPPKHTDSLMRQEEIPEHQGLWLADETGLPPGPSTALCPCCLPLLCGTLTPALHIHLLKHLPFWSQYSPDLLKLLYYRDSGDQENEELTAGEY